MKFIYGLLWFYSSLVLLLAYPMDYNETAVIATKEALDTLITLISQNEFSQLQQQYNDDVSQINVKTYEKIKASSNAFSQRILEVQESASNVNADIGDCLEDLSALTTDEFYQKYTEECVTRAQALGLKLITLGYNKQTSVFQKKYDELLSYFTSCLQESDTTPYICAGVVEATFQEVKRILPAVKANSPQIERELKQQVLELSECSHDYVSESKKMLKLDFSNAKTCILDKINTV